MEALEIFRSQPVRHRLLKKSGKSVEGTHGISVLQHPSPSYPGKNSLAFEKCTGVQAAVRYVEELNLILFVISTLISPLGMAFMPIAKILEKLLDRSCNKDVSASPAGKRAFWSFTEIEVDLGRASNSAGPVKFVQDLLLGPIYNTCRFLGKLGTCLVSHSPSLYAYPSKTFPLVLCSSVRMNKL